MRVDGRYVKCAPALVLEFPMLHHRAFPQNQFGHRVREIRRLGEADIAFEDRHLAALFGDDQVAGMRRGPGLLRRRDEQQMHRRLQTLARGNINQPAVLEEGRIERRKRVVLALLVARQMFFDQSRVAGQCRGQAADHDALWLRPRCRREFRHVMAVHEHQPAGGQPAKGEFGDGFRGEAVARDLEDGFEGQLGDGRYVREPPVLLLESWKPQFGKPRDARFAQREHPRRLLRLRFKPLERLQIRVGFFHCWIHYQLNHSPCRSKCLSN